MEELSQIDSRYAREGMIGKGGMKEILQVRNLATSRDLAMAVLPLGAGPDVIEDFLREARITALLQHPGIVPVTDIGIDAEGRPFFTMKKIDGLGLEQILAELKRREPEAMRRFPLAERIDLLLKIAEAIAYAHSRGVIHLDLKPENIRVGDFGQVLVCDWGLAQVLDEVCTDPDLLRHSVPSGRQPEKNTISGTPGAMAPEAWLGTKGRKDARTDIYALGALLCQLLCFETPVRSHDLEELRRRTLAGLITPPSSHSPEPVPSGLEAICLKALATRPEKRYTSVEAMIADLLAWGRGFAPSAEEAGPAQQLKLLLRRHRGIALTASAALILLGLCLVIFIRSLQSKEAEARRTLGLLQEAQSQRQAFAAASAREHRRAADESLSRLDLKSAVTESGVAWQIDSGETDNARSSALLLFVDGQVEPARLRHPAPLPACFAAFDRARQARWSTATAADFILSLPESHRAAACGHLLQQEMSLEARLAAVEELVRRQSPRCRLRWDAASSCLHLSRDIPGRLDFVALLPLNQLDFSGSELTALPVLPPLRWTCIDLSDSALSSLDSLNGLQVDRLELGGSALSSLNGIGSLKVRQLGLERCALRDFSLLLTNSALTQINLKIQDLPQPQLVELQRRFKISNPPPELTPRSSFLRLDRNHDLLVQAPEFPFAAALFPALDLDRDGALDWQEWRRLPAFDESSPTPLRWLKIAAENGQAAFEVSGDEVTCGQYFEMLKVRFAEGKITVADSQYPGGAPVVIDSSSGEAWLYLESRLPSYGGNNCPIRFDGKLFSLLPGSANLPLAYVIPRGADAFATWAGLRLPSQAQWQRLTALTQVPELTPSRHQLIYSEPELQLLFPLPVQLQSDPGHGLHGLIGSLREWLAPTGDDKRLSAGSCFLNNPEPAWAVPYPFPNSFAASYTGFRVVR